MLLRLQRYDIELVYRPGSQLILADTLSRAFPSAAAETVFTEDVAALATVDDEQAAEIRMVASDDTLALITAAAASDEEYSRLQQQIVNGWPDSPTHLPTDLRPYATFSDELSVSGRLHVPIVGPTGRSDWSDRLASRTTNHAAA